MAQLPPIHDPSLLPTLLRSRLPLRAGALGLLAGLAGACVISVNDGHDDGAEACYEAYDDCLDDAFPFGKGAVDACEAVLDGCLAECEKGDTGDGGSGGSSGGDQSADGDEGDGDGDGELPPRADEGGDGDDDGELPPRAEEGGDGDGDGIDPACFEIHANCVAEAQTIQDIEACEALFDNCIDPGPCEDECEEPGCPQAQLDACVGDYADCAAAALTTEEVLACGGMFDACIAQFDVGLCLPNYDDQLVLECLAQHELCVACADDALQLAACKTTFDNCLEV